MIILFLSIVAFVMGYIIYSLNKENFTIRNKLRTLENELLDLPDHIHESIREEHRRREFVENTFSGDLSRLGEIAKKAEYLSRFKAQKPPVQVLNEDGNFPEEREFGGSGKHSKPLYVEPIYGKRS